MALTFCHESNRASSVLAAAQPPPLIRECQFVQEIRGGAREDQEVVQPMGCLSESSMMKRATVEAAPAVE
jgi:hypothetical protein